MRRQSGPYSRNYSWGELIENGVEFVYGANEHNCCIDSETKIGAGTIIYPGVILDAKTKIGKNCIIEGKIIESIIGDYCEIGEGAEIKRSTVGSNTKAKHKCGVRDADVGHCVNISVDVEILNSDGESKKRTAIGNYVFLGGNIEIIGGFTIGDEARISARSLVDCDIPARTYFINMTPGVRAATKKDNAAWYLEGNYLKLQRSIGPKYRNSFQMKAFAKCGHNTKTFKEWLKTPLLHVGNRTPIEYIKEEGESSFACILGECGYPEKSCNYHSNEKTKTNPD